MGKVRAKNHFPTWLPSARWFGAMLAALLLFVVVLALAKAAGGRPALQQTRFSRGDNYPAAFQPLITESKR
jgi:hypothetical protein